MKADTTALIRLDAARTALAEARTIEEKKSLHDQAEAVLAYMKRTRDVTAEAQRDVALYKLEVERAIGDQIAQDGRRQGQRDQTFRDERFAPPKLSDIGITEPQSHRWQKLATIPGERFDRWAADQAEPTSVGLYRLAKDIERDAKRAANAALVAKTGPLPEGPFPTIVLDPPWDWDDEGDVSQFGRGDPTYVTMGIDELLDLPIATLAEPNAHVYLWITNRSLPKGFRLLERWGFRYVTALTWCKPSIGMGNYFRGSTEHILFGVRGSLPLLRRDVGTWFEWPRGTRHSEKPAAFFDLVEECSPGPWLELFARTGRAGWVSRGAEV